MQKVDQYEKSGSESITIYEVQELCSTLRTSELQNRQFAIKGMTINQWPKLLKTFTENEPSFEDVYNNDLILDTDDYKFIFIKIIIDMSPFTEQMEFLLTIARGERNLWDIMRIGIDLKNAHYNIRKANSMARLLYDSVVRRIKFRYVRDRDDLKECLYLLTDMNSTKYPNDETFRLACEWSQIMFIYLKQVDEIVLVQNDYYFV